MKRIGICNTSFEPGDAVSNDMLGMYNILLEKGYESRLFALTSSLSEPAVHPVEALPAFVHGAEDLCIYHYATGWEQGLNLFSSLACRKIIKYHNVTPSEFFEDINEDYAQACRLGRKLLTKLPEMGVDLYVACSDYSRKELIEAGAEASKCGIVPPFHHIDRLKELNADLGALDLFDDEAVNLLMVGRIAPNKGYDRLIDSFACFTREYNPTSRLLIVGGQDQKLQSYGDYLKNRIAKCGLENRVFFTGKVSDAALKAYYLVADIFLIASIHEGFCVPMIEAMSMKIPIVAVAGSAVTGTLGDSGILWEEFDPELIAASVNAIASDEHLRFALGEMGWKRYQAYFSNEKIENEFLRVLGPFL